MWVLYSDWDLAPAAQHSESPGAYAHCLGRRHLQRDEVGAMFSTSLARPGPQFFSPQLTTPPPAKAEWAAAPHFQASS